MELKKTTIKGREVYVIFTGDRYYFYSNYYGMLSVATRQETSVANKEYFTVYTGNRHTTGGQLCDSVIKTAVKRYINKEESQFISKTVIYRMADTIDLVDFTFTIDFKANLL